MQSAPTVQKPEDGRAGVSFTELLARPADFTSDKASHFYISGNVGALKYADNTRITTVMLESVDEDDHKGREGRRAVKKLLVEMQRMKLPYDEWHVADAIFIELSLEGGVVSASGSADTQGSSAPPHRLVFKGGVSGRYQPKQGDWKPFKYAADMKNAKKNKNSRDSKAARLQASGSAVRAALVKQPSIVPGSEPAPTAGPSTDGIRKRPAEDETAPPNPKTPRLHDAPEVRAQSSKVSAQSPTKKGKSKAAPLRKEGSAYALKPGEDEEELKKPLVVQLAPSQERTYMILSKIIPDKFFNCLGIPIRFSSVNVARNKSSFYRGSVLIDPTTNHAVDDGIVCTLFAKTETEFPPLDSAVLFLLSAKGQKTDEGRTKLTAFDDRCKWAAYVEGTGWIYSQNWGERILNPNEALRARNLIAWWDIEKKQSKSHDLDKIMDTHKKAPGAAAPSRTVASLPSKAVMTTKLPANAAQTCFGSNRTTFGYIRRWHHICDLDVQKTEFVNLVVEVIDFYAAEPPHARLTVTDYTSNPVLQDVALKAPGDGANTGPIGRRELCIYPHRETFQELSDIAKEDEGLKQSSMKGKYIALSNVHIKDKFGDTMIGGMHDLPETAQYLTNEARVRVKKLRPDSPALQDLLANKKLYETELEEAKAVQLKARKAALVKCVHADQHPRVYIREINNTAAAEPEKFLARPGPRNIVRAKVCDFWPSTWEEWVIRRCLSCKKSHVYDTKSCCGRADFVHKFEGKLLLEDDVPDVDRPLPKPHSDLRSPDILEIDLEGTAGFKFFGFSRDSFEKEFKLDDPLLLPGRFEAIVGEQLFKVKPGDFLPDEYEPGPVITVAVQSEEKEMPYYADENAKPVMRRRAVHTIFDSQVSAEAMVQL